LQQCDARSMLGRWRRPRKSIHGCKRECTGRTHGQSQ
jgi:hypothetical protein